MVGLQGGKSVAAASNRTTVLVGVAVHELAPLLIVARQHVRKAAHMGALQATSDTHLRHHNDRGSKLHGVQSTYRSLSHLLDLSTAVGH